MFKVSVILIKYFCINSLVEKHTGKSNTAILGPTYPFNQKSPASHLAILLLILNSDTKQTVNLQVIYIDTFSNQLIDFQA